MMKTLRFLAMSIIMLAAASCAKEASESQRGDTAGRSVSLTIHAGQVSRATDAPAVGGTTVTVDVAASTVYFLNSAENVVASRLLNAADDFDPLAVDNKIYTFEGVPSTATALYVVCNEGPADITYASQTNLSGILAGSGLFGDITAEYTALLMSNAAGDATTGTSGNASDKVALSILTPAQPDGTPALYQATVGLAPAVARLQLNRITATGDIDSYTLKGIYLDDHYPGFTVGAAADGTQKHILQDPANLVDFNPAMCDVYSTPVAPDIAEPLTIIAPIVPGAAVGDCWAWQVPTGAPSRIILALGDVVVNGVAEGDKYVTVRSYTEGATPVSEFIRAKVYNITELSFDENDLGDVPNAEPIDVVATLNVLPWTIVEIVPNL